jgi:hypothetical protein
MNTTNGVSAGTHITAKGLIAETGFCKAVEVTAANVNI